MSVRELFSLKPGDKFIADWHKDDNPKYHRFNMEEMIVASNDGNTLTTEDCVEFYTSEIIHNNWDINELDLSRGSCFFYYPINIEE